MGRVDLAVLLENTFARFGRDAGAGVADAEADQAAFSQADMDQHTADCGELDGVASEIEQNLAQAALVGVDVIETRIEAPCHFDTAAMGARRQQFGDALQQGFEGDFAGFKLNAAGVDAGIVEQVVDQGEEMLARFARRVDVGFLIRCQAGLRQQGQHADDAVERRADFMAHQPEEILARLEAGFARLRRGGRVGHGGYVLPGWSWIDNQHSRKRLRPLKDLIKMRFIPRPGFLLHRSGAAVGQRLGDVAAQGGARLFEVGNGAGKTQGAGPAARA